MSNQSIEVKIRLGPAPRAEVEAVRRELSQLHRDRIEFDPLSPARREGLWFCYGTLHVQLGE